jgi:dTDP-glucose 4,6-dehydratase
LVKVLVTGGRGAVGSVLVRELRGRGHEVWVSDLTNSGEPNYVRCDVGRYRQVSRIFEGQRFDYVYHLAAEFGRWNGEDFYETLWNTNAVGTKNMIQMQERHRFRMVFFSSSEVYGDYDGVMSEDIMDTVPIKQMNDYAMTKWVNEMQVLNSAGMHGTETVRVRLFNTYGPGEYYSPYRSALCLFMYRAMHDIPYTVYTGHHRTSTYVEDTARTLANITENFVPGEVYNIGGTEYHDMKEASDLILAYLGKSDSLVTYKEAEPHTTRDKKVDVTKAIRDLGHDPRVPLREGIPRTIEWMKSVYGKG